MLKWLKQGAKWVKGLFQAPTPILPASNRTKPLKHLGEMNGLVKIATQSQLDKQTPFKPGESYRVGEGIATVHATKASMLAAIAKVDAKRLAKQKRLTERAIQLMLMTPEQLMELKINEWLEGRKKIDAKIGAIMGGDGSQRYIKPNEPQPSGNKEEQFEQLMKEVTDKGKVH